MDNPSGTASEFVSASSVVRPKEAKQASSLHISSFNEASFIFTVLRASGKLSSMPTLVSFLLQVSSSSAASLGARIVLVGFGARGGHYHVYKNQNVLIFDPLELLKALKNDEGFGVKLRNVVLPDCTVHIALGASKSKPSDAEAATERPLEGGDTVGDVVGNAGCNIFIRIELPTVAIGEIMEHGMPIERSLQGTVAAIIAVYLLSIIFVRFIYLTCTLVGSHRVFCCCFRVF